MPSKISLVRCTIPRAAAATLDLDAIRSRARSAIIGRTLEFTVGYAGQGQVRITTDTRMAPFLADQLHNRVVGQDDELAIACTLAVGSLLHAIDDALGAPRPSLPSSLLTKAQLEPTIHQASM